MKISVSADGQSLLSTSSDTKFTHCNYMYSLHIVKTQRGLPKVHFLVGSQFNPSPGVKEHRIWKLLRKAELVLVYKLPVNLSLRAKITILIFLAVIFFLSLALIMP